MRHTRGPCEAPSGSHAGMRACALIGPPFPVCPSQGTAGLLVVILAPVCYSWYGLSLPWLGLDRPVTPVPGSDRPEDNVRATIRDLIYVYP